MRWRGLNFNPRPLREGTTTYRNRSDYWQHISIHVPYERGRQSIIGILKLKTNFNPRPLREGTTAFHRSMRWYIPHFNPRPLREGTTLPTAARRAGRAISIHVPYERGRLPLRGPVGPHV